MKKSRILIGLMIVFLAIGLVGCSNDDKDANDQPPVVENEDKDDEEAEDDDEEAEEAEDTENDEDVDDVDQMIDDAKYISKIKLITKGDKGSEVKVLDNIKAVLNKDNLPELNLEENRTYLVFLKEEAGNLVLVDEDDGLVLLEGDNHELFEKINKKVHQ